MARPRGRRDRRQRVRAPSCAIAKRAWIVTSVPERRKQFHARRSPGSRRAIARSDDSAKTTAGARESRARADQPEHSHLPDRFVLQSLRRQRSISASAARWRSLATAFRSASSVTAARCGGFPTLGGEFIFDRRFGYADGLMGGNLWLFGASVDSALEAAERGSPRSSTSRRDHAISRRRRGSGSKAGSRYSFSIASTYEKYCPQLRDVESADTQVPADVKSVMEIIINGRDLTRSARPPRLPSPRPRYSRPLRISAGNYGGRLGKSFIYLHGKQSSLLRDKAAASR